MQFGFGLPTQTPLGTAGNLTHLAMEGEALGFAYLTVSDHIVIPRDSKKFALAGCESITKGSLSIISARCLEKRPPAAAP